jgi:NAD+ synthase (glutamine-hydrolysing)
VVEVDAIPVDVGPAALEVVRVSHAPATPRPELPSVVAPPLDPLAELYAALVLATRDYVRKSGFSDVCLGLSGGIDSALVAVIAADAVGPEHVHAVLLPSRYSSEGSVVDAIELARNLGIDHRTVPIEPAHAAFATMLAPSFEGRDPGLADENVQSRVRGVALMGLANALGWLVLTTGNKSEAAVGYSTLYGDTAGAYAVIRDVWKLTVYELSHHVNARAGRMVIPGPILTKAPSAELRPDQRDDQSLPPYEQLDPLLEAFVERDRTAAQLVADGFDEAMVRRITRLVDLAEFKRRQTPLGPRVSTKAFGRDRRIPIVNRYRG